MFTGIFLVKCTQTEEGGNAIYIVEDGEFYKEVQLKNFALLCC